MSGATSGGAPEGGDGGAVANGAPAAAPYPQQRATEEMLWAFVRALKAENDQLRRQVQGAQAPRCSGRAARGRARAPAAAAS